MGVRKAKTPVEFTDLEIDGIRELLWNAASTYPRSILKRRLGFLNVADNKKVRAAMKYIGELEDQIDTIVIEQIDEVIAEEAEKRNDPWK